MPKKAKSKPPFSLISSRRVAFERGGFKVAGYIDEGPEASWNERVVILAPRYGETKKNNLQMSYSLAANHFKVLRFDHVNHVGESEGQMVDFTLPGAVEDILAAVDFVDANFEPAEIILVTVSLSARCGLRAAVREPRIRRHVCVVGMVDLDKTLKAIYSRDIFGEWEAGADWGTIDILGFEIEPGNFYSSLVEANLQNLDGTLADAAACTVPTLFLYAEGDRWVELEDVRRVVAESDVFRIDTVADVGHEIYENRAAVDGVLRALLDFCHQGMEKRPEPYNNPDKAVLIAQNRLERERLHDLLNFSRTESEFWSEYLGKFGIIEEARYYTEYFRMIEDALGVFSDGDVVVDAGCGNGFFGIAALRSLSRRARTEGGLPARGCYWGIDLSPTGLGRSYERQIEELVGLHGETLGASSEIAFAYSRIDFDCEGDEFLFFADESIDKICSSLVVSYLRQPLRLFLEFRRVLKPGGVAVVSSMKPGCDMTVLYHDSVAANYSEDHDRDAKALLSAAGKIKLKKDFGIYNFFSREELADIARSAGFKKMKVSRSFGNQANVICLEK